ncbi:MAG: GNAT family N-acetyltransferase [Puia sp.]|nr:GNAT family N-acetyltransferase [Puia sp.]
MIGVRFAWEDDLPAILEIYNEVIANTTAVYDYDPHTHQMRKSWYDAKKKENHPVFVATEGDKILGFSSYGPFRAWAAYRYTVENSVYVAADQRGKGIGKLLMAPVISSAREAGIHAIVAGIDAGNDVSLRLHGSFGFKEVAHFPEVGYKFNRWLDLKFLQLIIDNPADTYPGLGTLITDLRVGNNL